jgi:hypothetical protein
MWESLGKPGQNLRTLTILTNNCSRNGVTRAWEEKQYGKRKVGKNKWKIILVSYPIGPVRLSPSSLTSEHNSFVCLHRLLEPSSLSVLLLTYAPPLLLLAPTHDDPPSINKSAIDTLLGEALVGGWKVSTPRSHAHERWCSRVDG